MSRAEHWEQIYAEHAADRVGWYTPRLETSLHWIAGLALAASDPIIDVGGGASTLVDDLLAAGHSEVTVLDLSANALRLAQQRLPEKTTVNWLHGDVTSVELPPRHYKLWHDRAVFHFLTESASRRKYHDQLLHALQPGGHVIIGCFAPDAPPTCSGLPVQRYTAESLEDRLGAGFALSRHQYEAHVTPGGLEQAYLYCQFQRIS